MRKLTFGVANSLDHFIARADGSMDWLRWSADVNALIAASWEGVDTLLMGRKTWEFALASAPSEAMGPSGIRTYVLTRSLAPDPARDRGAVLVRDDAVAFVHRLKRERGGDMLLMGGGEVARSLFEAGLIDELGLNVHPVLLGSGVPLFHALNGPIELELTECRRLAKGCVLLRYRVLSA